MSGKVVLWLTCFHVITLIPNVVFETLELIYDVYIYHIYIYIYTSYIYISSVRPSCRVRPVVAFVVLCPSVRPVVRPVVVVRPLSIRPRPSVVVVRPLSVRPVVRLIITYEIYHFLFLNFRNCLKVFWSFLAN